MVSPLSRIYFHANASVHRLRHQGRSQADKLVAHKLRHSYSLRSRDVVTAPLIKGPSAKRARRLTLPLDDNYSSEDEAPPVAQPTPPRPLPFLFTPVPAPALVALSGLSETATGEPSAKKPRLLTEQAQLKRDEYQDERARKYKDKINARATVVLSAFDVSTAPRRGEYMGALLKGDGHAPTKTIPAVPW